MANISSLLHFAASFQVTVHFEHKEGRKCEFLCLGKKSQLHIDDVHDVWCKSVGAFGKALGAEGGKSSWSI